MSGRRSNYFWSGVLTVNGGMQHSIFEVKLKKKNTSVGTTGQIYTRDVPPLPIQSPDDQFHVAFYLENCVNLTEPTRFLIAEEAFHGSAFDQLQLGEQCAVRTENGEWQFMRVRVPETPEDVTPWFLTEIRVSIAEARFKQYMGLIYFLVLLQFFYYISYLYESLSNFFISFDNYFELGFEILLFLIHFTVVIFCIIC